jgi:hypothetical protein
MFSISALTRSLGEEGYHRVDREPARPLAQLLKDRIQVLWSNPRDVVHQTAHHRQERGRVDLDPLRRLRGPGLELLEQLLQLGRIPDDFEERLHARVVQLEVRPTQGACDDHVDRGRDALAFAQDFAVVDLADVDARSAGRGPQVGDATIGPHVLRRTRQQEQQRAPGVAIRRGVHRQHADGLAVEQHRKLAHRGVGLRQTRLADQQFVGTHV